MPARTLIRNYTRDVRLQWVGSSVLLPPQLRWRWLRACGLDVEQSAIFARGFYGSRRIRIGEGTFINYGVFFDSLAQITIGRNCSIGMNATFVTSGHAMGPSSARAGESAPAPINVGDGVWIGANATILPGVRIGDGAVVGAGAVVTHDIPADSVAVGVPAMVSRNLA